MKNENEKPVDTKKIREILDESNSARIRTWLSICSRCGLCAESCFFYLANNRDPHLSPAYKFKSTLGEMYRRNGRLDGMCTGRNFNSRNNSLLYDVSMS